MESKVSKAQIEVWEWKDKAFEQVKDMSKEERIKFILIETRDLSARLKRKNKAA